MDSVNITYVIKLSDQLTEVFDYRLDGNSFETHLDVNTAQFPRWTELDYKQCSHCPLNKEEHKYCPVAVQLHSIVEKFHDTRSIDEIELKVITEERTMIKVTALQNAISSLLGLVFPISGCPKTAGMKPLARFHVPMASEEETVFRVAGMYMMAQYFINNKGKQASFSFEGLIQMYDDLHIMNKAVASRLQTVTSSDSVKNAITLLDMYSSLIPALLQDHLVELRAFFSAYLPDDNLTDLPVSNYLEQAKAFKLELIPTDEELEAKLKADLPEWLQNTNDAEQELPEIALAKKDKPAVPAFSDFVLNLQLEPVHEKPDEKAKPVAAHQPPAEKKRAVFILPDDVVDKTKEDDDKPDDGGIKMIDFDL